MLIEISPLLNFSDPTKSYALAIENLASAAREGNHAIIGNLETLEFLSNWSALGVSARALFKTLIRKWPQFNSLESLVSKKIVVGNFVEMNIVLIDSIEEIQIPITMFDIRSLSQKTKIILEDLSDESVYSLIAEWYLKKMKNFSPKLYSFNVVHGGGQRTGAVLKKTKSSESCLVLCIVDTDKKHPNCEWGNTAKLVQSMESQIDKLNDVVYLEVHEIENLIPISVYNFIYSLTPNNESLRHGFQNLNFLEDRGALKFFDIKKGIHCLHLNNESNDSMFKEYWRPLIDSIGSKKDCVYTECNDTSCKKHLIKNWPKIKDTRIELERLQKVQNYDFDINPWLTSEWERIAKTILNWCLRYEPISA